MNKKKNLIKRNNKKFIHVILALFSAGFATFSSLYCVQPVLPVFSEKFNINPMVSSFLLSSSTITMAVGMLFAGAISDVIGRKVIMVSSLFLSACLTIFSSYIESWKSLIIMRSFMGISLSGVASIAMTYLNEEMHPSILPFSIGLYISGNTIGGFFGRILTSLLTNLFSLHVALLTIGCISFFSACVFTYFLPCSNNFKKKIFNVKEILNNFSMQWNNKILFFLFLVGFILMGSFVTLFNYIGYRLKLSPFFLNECFISLLSTVYLTGVYTSPQAGLLVKRYNYFSVLLSSFSCMLTGLLITQYNVLFLVIFGLMLFAGGFFSAHSVASSWVGRTAKKYTSQASSLYLFFYYFGSSIFGSLGGFFWNIGSWTGITCFVGFMLLLGILIVTKLKDIEVKKNNF